MSTLASRQRRQLAILAFAAVAAVLWSSCASATRERLLAALFDDPPTTEDEAGEADAPLVEAVVTQESELRAAQRVEWSGSWHGPHAAGLCQACHSGPDENPVAGGELARLRRQPEQLCTSCHDRDALLSSLGAAEPAALHGPVASGHCAACHVPHRSLQLALLRVPGDALCATCHGQADLGPEHPDPDGLDCTTCHDPHAPGMGS